ncbi:MAG: DUF192 domain-containing protein [Deltaproteobacteria bacterium]|nr:DUF192 domain-containing protein [Deltaproteobacteria bacterium]
MNIILISLALLSCRPAPRVVLSARQGNEVKVDVEIADSPAKRAQGLQYRRELREDQGMLFLFPFASVQTFWMKNTPLSLDLIFIGSDQKIVGIIHGAVPFSTATLSVSSPSQFVLEVKGGLSRRWGIGAGDPVRFENISVQGIKG